MDLPYNFYLLTRPPSTLSQSDLTHYTLKPSPPAGRPQPHFLELRPQTQVHGDAPEEAANASDLQEVRRCVEEPGDVEQEEHPDLGPG